MENTFVSILDLALGVYVLYVIAHFIVIQFSINWEKRNKYEKAITIQSILFILLTLLK
jgi:hypothetical protein